MDVVLSFGKGWYVIIFDYLVGVCVIGCECMGDVVEVVELCGDVVCFVV